MKSVYYISSNLNLINVLLRDAVRLHGADIGDWQHIDLKFLKHLNDEMD